jgi:hypothetical protein
LKPLLALALFAMTIPGFAQQAPAPAAAPAPAPALPPCLIVKHHAAFSGSVASGLFARGSRYDLVDSFGINGTRMSYNSSDLELMQSSGVKIVVLQSKYSVEELNSARLSCNAQ